VPLPAGQTSARGGPLRVEERDREVRLPVRGFDAVGPFQ